MNNNTLKCTVVMLPTESKSTLWQHTRVNKLYQGIEAVKDGSQRHLYIISDREIKDGDWIINASTRKFLHRGGYKKIEATTDLELCEKSWNRLYGSSKLILPSIPESFIEKYVKSYNNSKVIEDIMIETEQLAEFAVGGYENNRKISIRIKTRNDNTVIIHPIKDSYTRDEVLDILEKHTQRLIDQSKLVKITDNDSIREWFNKNY